MSFDGSQRKDTYLQTLYMVRRCTSTAEKRDVCSALQTYKDASLQEIGAHELPAKAAKMLRFAAHLGLALADLEIIPPQHVTNIPELAEIQVLRSHALIHFCGG